jgi:pyruvate/2-oxoglutarate/acetoin dehydrogenase E1 component
MRIGGRDIPVPYNPILEDAALPNEKKILEALKRLAAF